MNSWKWNYWVKSPENIESKLPSRKVMPTLGLVGSLWKHPFHYIPPFLRTVIFKILCLLERWKMVPGYFKISFFLNIYLPCQTNICHLWKIWLPFEWILECKLPGKKNFLETYEYSPLNINVAKSLWAFILIIMPNNGFFSVMFVI